MCLVILIQCLPDVGIVFVSSPKVNEIIRDIVYSLTAICDIWNAVFISGRRWPDKVMTRAIETQHILLRDIANILSNAPVKCSPMRF